MRSAATALAILAIACPVASDAQEDSSRRWRGWCEFRQLPAERFPPPRLNLPAWACEAAYDANLHARYSVYSAINPFFLSADFNGDGKPDIAVWVMEKRSRKLGVVVLHRGNKQPFVLGAGKAWEERGDTFLGIDMWSLIPKGETLDAMFDEPRKVRLKNDALLLGRFESASFAVYWDGKKYASYQLSD